MLKPQSLRRHLEAAVPWIAANPDHVLTFIDAGDVNATASVSDSFQYAYTLNLVFTDFGDHPDTIIVPMLGWLRINQPDMLLNPARMASGFVFEADILNHQTMDLSIKLQLTERVVLSVISGQLTATHAPEPPLDPYAGVVDTWVLQPLRPELDPAWTVPIPTPV